MAKKSRMYVTYVILQRSENNLKKGCVKRVLLHFQTFKYVTFSYFKVRLSVMLLMLFSGKQIFSGFMTASCFQL